MVAGSTVRYNANQGAQLINVNATRVELMFYAATTPAETLVDCYAIDKQGSGVTYSSCMPAANPSYSLLTSAAIDANQPGTHNKMAWR